MVRDRVFWLSLRQGYLCRGTGEIGILVGASGWEEFRCWIRAFDFAGGPTEIRTRVSAVRGRIRGLKEDTDFAMTCNNFLIFQ
jgi:hypothetical protein